MAANRGGAGSRRFVVSSITDLGAIAHQRRKELGWSIVETSDAAGTSRYFVADLEKGKPSCQFDKVMAVLLALQLKVELRAGTHKPMASPKKALAGRERRPLAEGPAIPLDHVHIDPETVGCLECGKPVRDLQKHLSSTHSMRTIEYRRRWRLPDDFDLRPRAVANAVEIRRRVKGVLKRSE